MIQKRMDVRGTSRIPGKGQVMIRFYGLYSNAHRGKIKIRKAGAQPSHPAIIDDDPAYLPYKGCAEIICKVNEVDPWICPSCGGKMP